MPWSRKAHDLTRDPRCVLHNVISAPDAGEMEFKLYGRAFDVDEEFRGARADAWWVSRRRGDARVVSLDIQHAVMVEWELSRGEMTVTRWEPQTGMSRLTREYP